MIRRQEYVRYGTSKRSKGGAHYSEHKRSRNLVLHWFDQHREPIRWNAHQALIRLNLIDEHRIRADRSVALFDSLHRSCRHTIRYSDVVINFCVYHLTLLKPNETAL